MHQTPYCEREMYRSSAMFLCRFLRTNTSIINNFVLRPCSQDGSRLDSPSPSSLPTSKPTDSLYLASIIYSIFSTWNCLPEHYSYLKHITLSALYCLAQCIYPAHTSQSLPNQSSITSTLFSPASFCKQPRSQPIPYQYLAHILARPGPDRSKPGLSIIHSIFSTKESLPYCHSSRQLLPTSDLGVSQHIANTLPVSWQDLGQKKVIGPMFPR